MSAVNLLAVFVENKPGQTARITGHVGAIDRVMALDRQVFVSSQASGDLYRLGGDGSAIRVSPEGTLARDSVTCSVSGSSAFRPLIDGVVPVFGGAAAAAIAPLVIVVLVLLFRPKGLLGHE